MTKILNVLQQTVKLTSNLFVILQLHNVSTFCDLSFLQENYWGIESGRGCQPCDCDPQGSYFAQCDSVTGQCRCKHGVTGQKCDECLPGFYGLVSRGECLGRRFSSFCFQNCTSEFPWMALIIKWPWPLQITFVFKTRFGIIIVFSGDVFVVINYFQSFVLLIDYFVSTD